MMEVLLNVTPARDMEGKNAHFAWEEVIANVPFAKVASVFVVHATVQGPSMSERVQLVPELARVSVTSAAEKK